MRYLLLLPIILFACQSTPVNTEAGNIHKDTLKAGQDFYPIAAFVAEELKFLDENPVAVSYYKSQEGKLDSGYANMDLVKALAARFMAYDLNSSPVKKFVKEESFVDETINLVTFNYTVNSEKSDLKRADVLVKQGDVKSTVSSIYLETSSNNNDTLINAKLYWKTKESCMIIEQLQTPDGKELVRQTRLKWSYK